MLTFSAIKMSFSPATKRVFEYRRIRRSEQAYYVDEICQASIRVIQTILDNYPDNRNFVF